MLFLPPSLLRSLCVLVLIPSAILGVWAMPLAPRDTLSTIPQLESRAPGPNRNLKLPLVLLRYNKGGSSLASATVQDRMNPGRDSLGITLLEDGEYWVLRLGPFHPDSMFFEAKEIGVKGAVEIRSRQPSNNPQLGVMLGDVTIKGEEKNKLRNAIQSLPCHSDEFSALQEVVKYLLGKTPGHPLLDGVVYNPRLDTNQLSIFSAMADPDLVHQYPNSLYLKLKPGVTKDDWWQLNKLTKDNQIRTTWPFRGTLMEGRTLFPLDLFESEDSKVKAGRSDGLPQ
ncbi:MAG: hypothetical protein NXY57DRAFT_1041394 [Lentinula lateritia]|nr:MAG: hypothetical protein NXY57DRAFT_1041394 [Lentinula lateritia]